MQGRRVLLLGATGLVGSELLKLLAADAEVERITVIARRAVDAHAKVDVQLIDFGDMDRYPDLFAVDQIFCALGTTIRKAGSEREFRKIDHDFPLMAARLGVARGARHYLLVSSMGADSGSRVFYTRVKGETENGLLGAGFRSVTIARPSLLLGPRAEYRRGEEIAKRFGWLMPAAFKPIEARDVAVALVESARVDAPGVHILESRTMRRGG